jgi:Ala-tRNA(Pro) deacylase
MPATRQDLDACLAALGIATVSHEHLPLHTVEESRALRGTIPGGHTKNLFLKDRKDALFLVTTGEEAVIDLKRIHEIIGAAGRVSFGKPELLMETLGVAPGAVTVFGALNDRDGRVSVILDAALMVNETLNCHPLVNTATTSIGRDDLVKFLRATGHEPRILAVSAPQL